MTIIIVMPLILAILAVMIYNSFMKSENKVKQAYSSIDIYLLQRFDLIPNLIECVKGYMVYEKETLKEMTELRIKYLENKNLKDGEKLNNECNQILVNGENYSELKASEQFKILQKNLQKIENQLQAARRIYNMEVNTYNNKINMFPTNIIASLCGFKEKEYFSAEVEAKENLKVEID